MLNKKLLILFLSLVLLISINNVVLANEEEVDSEVKEYPENILNIYKSENEYISVGIKHYFKEGIYFGGNLEYRDNSGIDLELNSVYMIPDIFIWDVYGGGGITGNIKNQSLDPYLLLGNEFIFLFSEVKYYLSDTEVEYRSGFKFEF